MKCDYCGYDFEGGMITRDHIVAKSIGGSDDESNIASACFYCNIYKYNYPFKTIEQVRSFIAFRFASELTGRRAYSEWRKLNPNIDLKEHITKPTKKTRIIERNKQTKCAYCGGPLYTEAHPYSFGWRRKFCTKECKRITLKQRADAKRQSVALKFASKAMTK